MRGDKSYKYVRDNKFFRFALDYNNLELYYTTIFAMTFDYKYSLSEVEQMLPWEREIFLALINQRNEEQREELAKQGIEI